MILIGLRADETESQRLVVNHYADGLRLYRDRNWDAAIAEFHRVLQYHATDDPSRRPDRACRNFRESPPGDDWDGASHIIHK